MNSILGLISTGPKIVFPSISYKAIGPEIILIVGALVIMLVSSLAPSLKRTKAIGAMAFGVTAIALIDSIVLWSNFVSHGASRAIASSIVLDGFAIFLMITISSAALLSVLAGEAYLSRSQIGRVEYHCLLLLSSAGAILLASAGDLIVVFLGLEILSIALYVMAAFEKRNQLSGEAGLKYFILGGFSSAIFLYGIALTYGATGTTNIQKIASFLATNTVTSNGVLLAGIALLIVGLGFKVAAVPFHLWTPDVYQGAPAAASGYMAAVAKAAGFAGLLRILITAFPTQRLDWQPIIWGLAALTLVVGAILAIVQSDIKRMLAYSSINHAGFVLLGVAAGTAGGVSGSLYYLIAYTFMVIGTFAIVNVFEDSDTGVVPIERLRGLARTNPALALFMAVLLVAQAGAPLTTGLLAKFSVIAATVKAHSYILAVIAMLSAVIATFFYLRVVAVMYSKAPQDKVAELPIDDEEVLVFATDGDGDLGSFDRPEGDLAVLAPAKVAVARSLRISTEAKIVVGISILFTVGFGIFPNPLVHMADLAKLLF